MALKQIIKDILYFLHIDITKNQQYDRQTKAIFKKILKADSNCIDVGCHKGEIMHLMLKFSPKGQHFGFEPIPVMFEHLKKNFSNHNCKLYNLALSNEKGQTAFNYVVNEPAYSGIKKRNYDNKNVTIEEIKVTLDKLDNVIPDNLKIDLIKIDVEGAELGVLKGAEQLLKKYKPAIIFEHGKGASDFYGTSPEDIYEFLAENCGYKISLLKSYLNNSNSMSKASFKEQFDNSINYYFVAHT